MELTAEQQAIVRAGEVDLGISAGAGTGKTHVLVERYVRLLDQCAIPQIVAVTFTEAAAAEMRQRVRREVLQRPELAAHRPFVDDAVIGTIHSLCLRILREHPVEAGLDPAIAVLGEDEGELLRLEACAAAIDTAAEAEDARTMLLGALGVYQANQVLPTMVATRDDVRAAVDALPAEAVAIAEVLHHRLDEACERVLGPLRTAVPAALAEVAADITLESDLLAQKVRAAQALVAESDACDIGEWGRRLTETRRALDLRGGTKAGWAIDPKEARAALKIVRDSIDEATKHIEPWNEHDEACVAALPGLRLLFEDACHRYEALKHEAHGLDFLDLEVAAVELLERHPEVTAGYRRVWNHLMVDEAQDVSGIQARLFRALAGESALTVERPRLFLVGDEKQSIYRFRGAQVRQFRELRAEIRAAGGELLPLSASFRTHTALVDQANALFDHAFEGREVTMERMSGRPGEPPTAPHLTVMPIARDGEGHQKRLAEADLVAAEIRELIDTGRLIWDKRAQQYRPVRAGDVAILLRRYRNVHLFEQALESRGVPSATPSGTGFFTRPEVLDLTNLLRWLVEPDDQIALFGILRSPLFILRDDTLYHLRGLAQGGRRPLQYALREPPEALDEGERSRCLFAAGVLNRLQRAARTRGAADLVEEALVETGYEASWAAVSGAEQTLANVRKFVRLCRDLSSHTTAEVVAYLERRRDELVTREGPAVLDRLDAVQIMTVHGAKGLEFPVVFLPEAQGPPYVGNEAVRWRPDEGISFTLERREGDDKRPRPASYAMLTQQERDDETEEHLRLFYVAATRAGDYLYVSGEERGQDGWMPAILRAIDEADLRAVEVRPSEDAPTRVLAHRPRPRVVDVPAAADEVPYVPPLLARPPVIPLRASTPATSLRGSEPQHQWLGRGDGLGLVRGRIIHRVIELTATLPPDGWAGVIDGIVTEEAGEFAPDVRAALAAEAREMLDRFRASPLGEAIVRSGDEARFEVPFAWHWDGVPVHGQIDLLYRDPQTGEWWVVDFKSDRVAETREAEAAAPYLVQLGIYAGAVGAATGTPPRVGLMFLRSGVLYEPDAGEVTAALAETREAIDAGLSIWNDDDLESREALTAAFDDL